ncbi:hypothetical protein SAMN04488540_103275 [Ferrimonas sediminum]|uniref:Ig-like domain-containing protein n=1 Tax=Ferrimonas sediminum TaxID=718193 RepID=A0A1G8NYB2_9GAMM|nr:hypothetical protein [Ferrimonas sediminum]SDI85223.1 hypothetical protein SAMN04488540_103275 [Ferrimonas sediminum]
MIRSSIPALLLVLITGCGGSGGGSTLEPSPLPPEAEIEFTRSEPDDGSVAIVATVDGVLSRDLSYQWQQQAGPTIHISNPRSAMAAFEAPASDDYQLKLTVTDTFGNQISNALTHSAEAVTPARIRGDQVVSRGGRVSLRLGRSGDKSQPLTQIQWSQVGGPPITEMNSDNPELLTFTAPSTVGKDSLLTLKVIANDRGSVITDHAYVWVTDQRNPVHDALFDTPLAQVRAWNPASPWRSALERCVYSTQLAGSNTCRVSELPPIGQQTHQPSVSEVMNRVVVSHPWMGDAFKAFLEQRDSQSDFRRLLASVSAVVISYDIRPSFYWVATGAIYLDPSDLWREPWQQASINEDPDYRSGFGNGLNYLLPWRYVKDNQYASTFYPSYLEASRGFDQLEGDLASLLYHELAHANDFFPVDTLDAISADTLLQEYYDRSASGQLVSDQLTNSLPLSSSQMFELAKVQFQGETASAIQKAYRPSDISGFFSQDRANDDYNYFTPREDLAMLFEEAMMSHRYGILRDVAVTDKPDAVSGDTIIVDWGQRGRIGEPTLLPRLDLVVRQILPSLDPDTLIDSLPATLPMTPGQTWNANLVLGPAAKIQRIGPAPTGARPPLAERRHFGRGPDWKLSGH